MKSFTTKKKALEYATKNIGKYEYEVVEVQGVKTILCSTSLPIESRIRDKVEEIMALLLTDAGENPDTNEARDEIAFMGAEMTEYVIQNVRKYLDIDILSANLNY